MNPLKLYASAWLFIIACTLFFIPSTANAQSGTNGIDIKVNAGLDGWYKQDGWIRVQVEASNSGPAFEGTIATRLPIGDAIYSIPISLATQSNKKVEFYVFAQGIINRIELVLLDQNGDLISEYNSELISTLPTNSMLYGVVSSQIDPFDLLSDISGGRPDTGVAYLDIEDLPLSPAGWVPFDVLIFSDVDTNQLTLPQRTAIDQWIQLGGQLIVTGGASWQKSTAVFEELLPVTVNGSESISDLPQFSQELGESFRDPGPYVVSTSSLRDGEIIYREEGLPLLSRRAHGQGNVYFLALDPQFAPLVDWDGSEVLLKALANEIDPPIMWEQGFVDNSRIFDSVSTIPSLSLPSNWLILFFMLSYILLVGPANYIVLNRLERLELAWLTIPASILVFSGVAFVIGLQFKGNQVIINEVSVVTGQAGGPTVYNTAIGVYSPNRSRFNLELEGETVAHPLNRLGFDASSNQTNVTYGGSSTGVSEFLVDVGGVFPLETLRIEGENGIQGQVVLSGDGATGAVTLTNRTGASISNATLLIGASNVFLGEIGQGETVEREVNIPSGFRDAFLDAARGGKRDFRLTSANSSGYIDSPIDQYYVSILTDEDNSVFVEYDIYDDSSQYQRFQLLEGLYDQYDSTELYTPLTSVTLIGWSEASTLETTIDTSRVDRSALTLYFIDLPLEAR